MISPKRLIYYRNNRRHGRKTILEFLTVTGYVIAGVLFLLGGVFLPSMFKEAWGAWGFIIGSALFAVGAVISVTQITEASMLICLQLLNAVAICFRYWLDSVSDPLDSLPLVCRRVQPHAKLFTYLAAQFIFASLLFLAGGGQLLSRPIRMHYYRASNGNYENEDQ